SGKSSVLTGLVTHLDGQALHFLGHLFDAFILGQHGKHGLWLDHANTGLTLLGIDRDAARQSHIEAHILCQHLGCLLRITDFEYPALLCKINSLAPEGSAQIMDMQYAKTVSCYGILQITTGLLKGFLAVDDVIHKILLIGL